MTKTQTDNGIPPTAAPVLIGTLTAVPVRIDEPLQSADHDSPATSRVTLINERINPPVPVKASDIHIRRLRLVSDAINDHGGRFPTEELARLCELIIDSPVLIGHDRSGLPIARNFDAQLVADETGRWVEVDFYWLRGPAGDLLAADIDSGIVKEGSIGFEFRRPQCSICAGDIRSCDHIPQHEYTDVNGVVQCAHYEYRELIRVLETSLVYRGATPNTRFVPERLSAAEDSPTPRNDPAAPQAVVLDSAQMDDGGFRCRIALRDPGSAHEDLECLIRTDAALRVGDRLTLRKTTDAADCGVNVPSKLHCGDFRVSRAGHSRVARP